MTLTLDFQGKIFKKSYLNSDMADWHGMKGMWVDRMLDPCCDFQRSPRPCSWIFIVKFWKCCISGMGGLIEMEQKGCESIGCYTHFVTFNFWAQPWPWPWIFKVKFWKSRIWNGVADWHGMKGMWVDKVLDPCWDFQRSPHPWPWPWIFRVKFWNSRILWMWWPIDMERRGCESIECWSHDVTFNVHLFLDFDLGFSWANFEKLLSQEWDGWLTWNKRDVSPQNVRLTLWLQALTSPMIFTLDFQGKILKLL